MSNWLIYGIGFLAQLLFSVRLINQWFLSEKAEKVKTPRLFWKLSLFGSMLLFIYGYLRNDLAIMLGQFLVYAVYFRNLHLQNEWKSSNIILKLTVIGVPILIAAYLIFLSELKLQDLLDGENIAAWLIVLGILGQIVYTSRFFYQWIYSEQHEKSSLPLGFWILSLAGSTIIFIYAIFRRDPVLLAAHFFGGMVYIRDLFLLKKSKK
ncbi:lipid-A-disaccharide synthase N-terminal domain-containing protein [Gillisia limnaea]|uniref:Lipid A biosynthesis domain protein n=1 Tax=Gillisia limnaea (strain DSM 15749 / LMG 21470 / R-8282) TaxID=865937 RepID=H2BRV5_GILLR|nr:lipid-A-disaccharide synthase N-terminal domain-containing protein [Gillisia limnaea]EHQ02442.1 lipid A biosynthesis domain protein [Gillisia limnaea DSM 15749]